MNKNKITALAVGVVVILIAVLAAVNQPRGKQPPRQYNAPSSTTADAKLLPVYTLAQVSVHKDVNSCWTIINGNVYDLTPWVSQHPGGEGAILSICGQDGSAAFNDQHGGQRRPENILEKYKIGSLK